jgi:integrase
VARLSEVCQLRWRSVDLHHKRLVVEQSKTDAGVREVDLSLDLLDELLAWRAESAPEDVDAFVFATLGATRPSRPQSRSA